MTAIHYLLAATHRSHFHKIDADEMWHYLSGNTDLLIHVLHPNGQYEKIRLEHNRQKKQFCVPAHCWFAAELDEKEDDKFAFINCTVAPGFLFDTFELAENTSLKAAFPAYHHLIDQFTT